MSNETLQSLPLLALFLQLAVLGWRWRRRDARPMRVLNAVAAVALAIPLGLALAQGPERWADGFYLAMAALLAFEMAVLATTLGAFLRHDRALGALAGFEFAVHFLLTTAALIFVMTFRIDRLF